MIKHLSADVLIGKAPNQCNDWGGTPTSLRRRAEKLRSVTERNCMLESHSHLALLKSYRGGQPNFSVSRRSGYFAVALHPFEKIGVDLEQVVDADDIEAVAFHYFPARLYQIHSRLPEENRPRHFAACWSALEAVAKLHTLPLESAGASLDTAVFYQCWFESIMVLSIALNNETPLQLTLLTDTVQPSALTRASPFSPEGYS